MTRPHVIVVGGGFGGLSVAQGLRRADVDVTVVDRTNHHLFQPLLYQVATSGLAPSDIAEPIRALLSRQRDHTEIRLADVREIDVKRKRVRVLTEDGEEAWMPYDTLVVAAGASHSYFGHPDWEPFAPGLKTLGDALEVRRRVLSAFERAEWANDPEERQALMTFVVVGGGPTGVELAGALAEIACTTLKSDFRHVDTTRATILLVEAADTILATFHPNLQKKAIDQLTALGVEVRLGKAVTAIDEHGVRLGDDRIAARTVLWAAGVAASPLVRSFGAPLDRAGRVFVEPDLSVPGHPEVFVIGDLAASKQEDGTFVPGVAPAAQQMGTFVAKQIRADLAGKPRGRFRYFDKGSMATVGRTKAVLETGPVRVAGFAAWLLWVVVHIWSIVSLRNRLIVMLRWAWAWWGYRQAVRLIWHPSTAAQSAASEKASHRPAGAA